MKISPVSRYRFYPMNLVKTGSKKAKRSSGSVNSELSVRGLDRLSRVEKLDNSDLVDGEDPESAYLWG